MDNYDSFTDNLHHLLKQVRPPYHFEIHRNTQQKLMDEQWDGLVISPGPKGPADTGLLKRFFQERVLPEKMPTLGICLGMQFLAWFYGLDISETPDARHGRTVSIDFKSRDLFESLIAPISVMRYNSLALNVDRNSIEKTTPLEVLAVQEDTGMIMALKHRELPFLGVQFHPESFLTEQAPKMMENFFRIYIDD